MKLINYQFQTPLKFNVCLHACKNVYIHTCAYMGMNNKGRQNQKLNEFYILRERYIQQELFESCRTEAGKTGKGVCCKVGQFEFNSWALMVEAEAQPF